MDEVSVAEGSGWMGEEIFSLWIGRENWPVGQQINSPVSRLTYSQTSNLLILDWQTDQARWFFAQRADWLANIL